jgi:hypothetical protein
VPELRVVRATEVARHELPDLDACAMKAAALVDRLVAEANRIADEGAAPRTGRDATAAAAAERWAGYFQHIPDQLRDEPVSRLRLVARRARAAYGPKDSIRDLFAPEFTEPLLDAIDRLVKAISRYEAERG